MIKPTRFFVTDETLARIAGAFEPSLGPTLSKERDEDYRHEVSVCYQTESIEELSEDYQKAIKTNGPLK